MIKTKTGGALPAPLTPAVKARNVDLTCRRPVPQQRDATDEKRTASPPLDRKRPPDRRVATGTGAVLLLLAASCAWLRFDAVPANRLALMHASDDDAPHFHAAAPPLDRSAAVRAKDDAATARADPPPVRTSAKAVDDFLAGRTGVLNVDESDRRCKLVLSGEPDPEGEFEENKRAGIGPPEPFSLGPCQYIYPQRLAPPGGWVDDVDWYMLRQIGDATARRREECFVKCLDLMERLNVGGVTHDMLATAAFVGLQDATRMLVERHHLDPLRLPPAKAEGRRSKFRMNAVQAAIMGGYAEVVKTLTGSNVDMVIDEHGRTVRDYVQMAGSAIRPHYAKRVLGIASPPNQPRKPEKEGPAASESGWNSTAAIPHTDTGCDFDVIDTAENDMSFETFLKEYYLPGRPVVLRNQASPAEVESFSKRSWSKLEHFHPTTPFKVGNTAYPALSQQEKCGHKLTIEQLERDERCADFRELHMMHAEHGSRFDEAYAMYDGDPAGGNGKRGGFRKLDDWFDTDNPGWQIFFGSDGSGATIHWHFAALNILYVGTKEWRITPPQYRGFSGMPAERVKATIEDKPFSLKCTQIPGDLIYIPDYWGHMTINHGFGIGVAAIVPMENRFAPGYIGKEEKKIRKENKGNGVRDGGGRHPQHGRLEIGEEEKRKRKKNKGNWVRDWDGRHRQHGRLAQNERVAKKNEEKRERPSVPFFFVHINKTGGSSLISMLKQHCTSEEYVREHWETETHNHRSFHSTAHSYLARHGRRVWDEAYSFAVVRHPLARQVSNFFFLLSQCEENEKRCRDNNDRLIPTAAIKSSSTDEEKIEAFHKWMRNLYQAYPPSSPQHHLFGSKGHGNEEYPTMNATQTSWLVDETGREIVVKAVFKLEHLSDNMGELHKAIPCLAKSEALATKNQTPKYPHYSRFANNKRTNKIMREVYAVDYSNFGYDFV